MISLFNALPAFMTQPLISFFHCLAKIVYIDDFLGILCLCMYFKFEINNIFICIQV